MLLERLFAEIDHLLGRCDLAKQGTGGLVDAGIGRLRRQHDRDQQLIVVAIFQFRDRRRICFGQAAEKVEYLCLVHVMTFMAVRGPARLSCRSARRAGRRAIARP